MKTVKYLIKMNILYNCTLYIKLWHKMSTCAESTGASEIRVLFGGGGGAPYDLVFIGRRRLRHGALSTLRVQPFVQLLQVCAWPGACVLSRRAFVPPSTPHQSFQGVHTARREQRLALHRAILPAGNRWVRLVNTSASVEAVGNISASAEAVAN